MKKKFTLNLVILLVCSLLVGCGDKPPVTSAKATLSTQGGQSISFTDLKGKYVVINYWASWCPPCKKEIPELNAFSKKHQNDVITLAYNFDGLNGERVKEEARQAGIEFPLLAENPSEQIKLGEVIGLPVTYVFNPKGELIQTLYKPQTVASLEKALKS